MKNPIIGIIIFVAFLIFCFGAYYLGKQFFNNVRPYLRQTVKNTTNQARLPVNTIEKSKIIAADFTENCQIIVKTSEKDYIIHTGYESAGGGRCYQYAQLRISPSGQYVAFEDISGGVDSKISLYILSQDKTYGLGVYGTSDIFGLEFLPDDRLIVSNGYKDTQPPEQSLTVLDVPQMVRMLPPTEAEWYTRQSFDAFIKNLDLTGLDHVYEFLVIRDMDVQIKDTQGKIGRSFPIPTDTTSDTTKAIDILKAIPEVQTIETLVLKAGRKPFYTPEVVKGDVVSVSLRESFPDDLHTSRIDTFNVNLTNGIITVEDVVSGGQISLEEWKKKVNQSWKL